MIPHEQIQKPERERPAQPRLWPWALIAILGVTVAAVAWLGRDQGPTLRAMSADVSMSDLQARAVADNTVRVWIRERNAGHLRNVQALTCPEIPSSGLLHDEVERLRQDIDTQRFDVVTTGAFEREGPVWTLNVLGHDTGAHVTMRIIGGELRICDMGVAPIP